MNILALPIVGLPLWILITAALTGVSVTSYIFYRTTHKSTPLNDGQIALLGPKESGKSQFLNWLKENKLVEPDRTGGEEPFDFKYQHNGKTYRIKGKDITGDESVISRYYEDIIKESNSILFFFDCNQFISTKEYRHDVCKRVRFVYDHLHDKCKVFCIVATHLDLYGPEWHLPTVFSKKFKSKADFAYDIITNLVNSEYPEINHCFSNMTATNLKDKDSVKLLINRLFVK